MTRLERIVEFQVLDNSRIELEKQAKALLIKLRAEVCGRNECLHLVGQIPEYENHFRPACKINAHGERGNNDQYNWVDLDDCATCSRYIKNPDVKKSLFLGSIYKRGEP